MNADLFLKRVPTVIKDLIGREATENRRSINQEAIALLEEALLNRMQTQRGSRRQRIEELAAYAQAPNSGFGELPAAAPLYADPMSPPPNPV